MAGGIAAVAILGSSGAFAGTVDDEIVRIDQLLAATSGQSNAQRPSLTQEATKLRDEAAASLRAGDEQTADAQAKLALHELGTDAIPVDADSPAFACIGGCPGTYVPSVSADAISGGAQSGVEMVPDGRGLRAETVPSTETGTDAAKTAATQTGN
jgi:hypothetical protein